MTNREKASPIDAYLIICEDLKDSNRVYLDIYLLLMEILLLTNNGAFNDKIPKRKKLILLWYYDILPNCLRYIVISNKDIDKRGYSIFYI